MEQSAITSVTVFTDRARVTRVVHKTLEPGVHKVDIPDLPMRVIDDSLRASGRGTARARLLGVASRVENYVDTPAVSARELEQQKQDLDDSIAALAARAAALAKEQAALEGLLAQSETFARGISKGKRTAEEQIQAYTGLRERLGVVLADGLALGKERRELEKQLDRVKRRLADIGAARPRQRRAATVEVEVLQAGDLDIELSYMLTGASWTPLYDLRYTDAGLEVRYLAEVSQNSGEDWTDVALTLSTAQPSVTLDVPELDPWYIMPRPPPAPPQVMRSAAMRTAMPAAAPAPGEPTVRQSAADQMMYFSTAPMEEPTAEVSESGAALTYALPARADVPGNGGPRKVTVAVFTLKPKLDYITAPKLEALCYRRCTVKNDSAYTLLPGVAQLFERDDYLGSLELEQTAPNQEIELALGADERVRVERELTGREVDKTLLSDRRRTRYSYKIEVENLRDQTQTVIVRDQLPVSRSEEIKVKLESAQPAPASQSDLNLLEWKLSLAAGIKQTVRFEYIIEHPRAMEVLGIA